MTTSHDVSTVNIVLVLLLLSLLLSNQYYGTVSYIPRYIFIAVFRAPLLRSSSHSRVERSTTSCSIVKAVTDITWFIYTTQSRRKLFINTDAHVSEMLGRSCNYCVTVITLYIRPTLHYIFILFKSQQAVGDKMHVQYSE